MTTFITTLDATGAGPRLAVKDLIDVAGVPTTAGCRAVARTAAPTFADAACLAGARAADAGIVGKTNLHELAMLPLGTNPWFGTPVNPLDPSLIAGGSSSGSAVAVANPAGRYRAGLRHRRVNPGALGVLRNRGAENDTRPGERAGRAAAGPSLDTVGPTASSVAGVAAGMALLEPGFRPDPTGARVIGRLRTAGDPRIGPRWMTRSGPPSSR